MRFGAHSLRQCESIMLSQLFKKEHHIESLIYHYLDAFQLSQENFSKAVAACLLNGTFCDKFEFFIHRTHKYESKADDILQEIYDQMYGKALIPESRGDILDLGRLRYTRQVLASQGIKLGVHENAARNHPLLAA